MAAAAERERELVGGHTAATKKGRTCKRGLYEGNLGKWTSSTGGKVGTSPPSSATRSFCCVIGNLADILVRVSGVPHFRQRLGCSQGRDSAESLFMKLSTLSQLLKVHVNGDDVCATGQSVT